MSIRPIRSSVLAGLAALALAGCGGITDSITENVVEEVAEQAASVDGQDVDIDFDADGETGSINVTGPDGEQLSIGAGGDLPQDFPADIPLPDGGYEVLSSFSDSSGAANVTLQASGSYDDLVAQYESALPAAGYEITSQFNQAGSSQVYTAEGNGRTLNVSITTASGTNVNINVTPDQQ